MCLVTNQKKAKIAKKDIKVFKLFNENRTSYVQHFYYINNKEYSTLLGIEILHFPDLSNLEFWDGLAKNYYTKFTKTYKTIIIIREGFHSFITKERAHNLSYLINDATIPKGAEYYLDGTGLIVSNKLIVH